MPEDGRERRRTGWSSPRDLDRQLSVPLYQAKAEFFKTLGHPARIRVLSNVTGRWAGSGEG